MERKGAIEVIKKNYPHCAESCTQFETALRTLISELAKSEDERIRKMLIKFYSQGVEYNSSTNGIYDKDIVAWLEKQGNKPQGKTALEAIKEEKVDNANYVSVNELFSIGDWVIANGYRYKAKIKAFIENDMVEFEDGTFETEENLVKDYHLWTIQDAKDGDVLVYKDEISLYKHDIKNCTKQETTFGGFVYHCCYDGKRFITNSLYSLTEQDKIDIHPATKEQSDTLFAKMNEAGYEWDKEKKELKKIEDESKNYKQQIMSAITDLVTDYIRQKPAWSEEDETSIAVNNPDAYRIGFADDEAHAKEEMTSTWSEEDEKMLVDCVNILHRSDYPTYKVTKTVNWLKTLKERMEGAKI